MRDTDYVALSARIRAMEPQLLTRERMERVLEARDNEELEKLLQEWGYPAFLVTDPPSIDGAIAKVRESTKEDLSFGLPQEALLDAFIMEYDYHNVKSLLKAQAMDVDAQRMLSSLGRVSVETLMSALQTQEYGALPVELGRGMEEAKAVLDATRDPQQCDMVLDRWYYREMLALSNQSEALHGYVLLKIDAVNLRIVVRALRMGKPPAFLQTALFEGGTMDVQSLVQLAQGGGSGLEDAYRGSALETASMAGSGALKGGPMTVFELDCDDAVSQYWDWVQMVPFGEAVLLSYLAAKETEYLNLRIVLLGRSAGASADVIRSRLRR